MKSDPAGPQTIYRHSDEVSASIRAAERIVPIILEVVGPVASVVDLGGGTGAWLRVFQESGVETILLIDSPTVESELLVGKESLQPADLDIEFPPVARFDLAVCVECAEHLRPDRAEKVIEWLTDAAERVVFSAAIPGQGGKGHINERPPEYWRDLFRERGFVRRDVLRPRILHDRDIPFWYRQNLYLFTRASVALAVEADDFIADDFELVYKNIIDAHRGPSSFRHVLGQLGPTLNSAIRRRVGRRS